MANEFETVRVIALEDEASGPEAGQYLLVDSADGTKKMQVENLLQAASLSDEAKTALLTCFEHVVWNDADGSTYIDALRSALNASDRRPELPDEYEQVEYIKGSGTQYINTGILSQIPFKGEIKIAYDQIETRVVSGSGVSLGATRFYMFGLGNFSGQSGAQNIASRFGDNLWLYNPNTRGETDTVYELVSEITNYSSNKVKAIINNKNDVSFYAEAIYDTPTVGNPVLIMKNASESACALGVSIYEIRFYAGSTLLFDGIPCYRKSDDVAGLYDAVTSTFFDNDGTGSFIVGRIIK